MILVDKISKIYGRKHALNEVSFQIKRHEVVGFLGLNGAGKTTVLKILSGAIWPSSGRVQVDGYDALQHAATIRRLVGFLPDRPPLYGDMSVTAMLQYAAQLNGLPSRDMGKRIDEVIETCQLERVRTQRIDSLSLGFRQRVGIAQAIVHRPALLILDEPISGLDPQQIVAARGLIRRLREDHTVLLSSHILAEIAHTCDRLLILHEGRIVAQGDEQALRAELSRGQFLLKGFGVGRIALDTATQLEGIQKPTLLLDQNERFELQAFAQDERSRAALVAALLQHGLQVHGLTEQNDGGLENLFLRLTGDASREASA
jgi:ABC-2 type transport system ATP-binding protein